MTTHHEPSPAYELDERGQLVPFDYPCPEWLDNIPRVIAGFETGSEYSGVRPMPGSQIG